MKLLSATVLPLATLMFTSVTAHYNYNRFIYYDTIHEPWSYIRPHTSGNNPLLKVTHPDMRCNTGGSTSGPRTQIFRLDAGDMVGFQHEEMVYSHKGSVAFYLGKPPAGTDLKSWDGSGANWIKLGQDGPKFNDLGARWSQSYAFRTRIPYEVPAGQYLLRIEQIGLEKPYLTDPSLIPEFYVACAQIEVVEGGDEVWPSVRDSERVVAIPGHIEEDDENIRADITSPGFKSYRIPGPECYWKESYKYLGC
ncbi:hypothetical protein BJ508DRAFT_412999 [Ascobolus immersus RN42]|uniref:AA9 family lytic polysaccharide monooxygenase n=1 Tax=Ascobolus immersus RN42 TaxID=1160509 RepID=A0A3N4IDV2_ASCIM|nr:hypothetical protein BJ508DRAFT_412999 [Ascobolus immersus RN42]